MLPQAVSETFLAISDTSDPYSAVCFGRCGRQLVQTTLQDRSFCHKPLPTASGINKCREQLFSKTPAAFWCKQTFEINPFAVTLILVRGYGHQSTIRKCELAKGSLPSCRSARSIMTGRYMAFGDAFCVKTHSTRRQRRLEKFLDMGREFPMTVRASILSSQTGRRAAYGIGLGLIPPPRYHTQ